MRKSIKKQGLFITLILFSAGAAMAQTGKPEHPEKGHEHADTMKMKKHSEGVKEGDQEHHNYSDTFNEHNKNKGGTVKEKSKKSDAKTKKVKKEKKQKDPSQKDKEKDEKKDDDKKTGQNRTSGGKGLGKQAKLPGHAPGIGES